MAFKPFIIETEEPEPPSTHVDGALHDTQDTLTDRQLAAVQHAVGLFRRALGVLEATFPQSGRPKLAAAQEQFAPTGDPDKDALERRHARLYARLTYANGHMLWPGATDRGTAGGKPIVQWHGKVTRVSRIVWEREVGPIPENGRLMPRCDVATCVSPKHHALIQTMPAAPPAGLPGAVGLPVVVVPSGPGLCRRGHPRRVQPNGRVVCPKCDRSRKSGRNPFEPDRLEIAARAHGAVDRPPAVIDYGEEDNVFANNPSRYDTPNPGPNGRDPGDLDV